MQFNLSDFNSTHLQFFNDHGYLHFNPVDEILEHTNTLLASLDHFGQLLTGNEHFNIRDPRLLADANKMGFFKHIRNLSELSSLQGSSTIRSLSSYLGVRIPCLGPSSIRLDISQEKSHQFGWHQDAPSLLGSTNMHTYWIPCTDVNSDHGTIELIPKSHNSIHLQTLDARDKHLATRETSSNLILNPNFALEQGTPIQISAKKGSIIVLHPLIIHRSYYPSNHHPSRITAILRVDDVGDLDHIKLGLKTALTGFNIFNSPEYVDYYKKYCSTCP
ncbi:phytanoyl-CoA dioxygenase family protein [Synechococcus sp. UW179B]|uniref:phytanoyl-CoA dioxygenase family protein n=1 Tax=Synechococcus sp. UW179B TaxID=2575516 RepID=UPI000E0F4F06|nr:phytanoyl-CoA dioxygenase family protein [Synechococcus sp. UW179B]